MLPQFEAKAAFQSASRWLWRDRMAKAGESCCFRCSFDVPGPVRKADIRISADDVGRLWMNGAATPLGAAGKAVREGRNTLAISVSNVVSGAGLLVWGRVELADGRSVGVHSDAATFRMADGILSDGWQAPDFDDAAWRAPVELGDVTLRSFARYRDFAKDFATDAERAAIARRTEELARKERELPAGLADEPEPVAKVVYVGGMPKISLNGTLVDADFNQSGVDHDYALNAVVKAASLGLQINQIAFRQSDIETAAGVYDFTKVDVRMRRLLRANPDGRALLAVRLELPKWLERHPEAMIGYASGPVDPSCRDERVGRAPRPSAASPEYRAEVRRLLGLLGAYVRAQPWGRRVVAIRPCWGIYTEWHTYGMYEGPDVGPAMTAAFRRWKGGLYANENPPTLEERAVATPKLLDFYACMANEVSDLLLDVAHAAKAAFPGRLVGMYYGYVLATHPPEGANVMLDKVLASPDVDFLSDPAMYTPASRLAGGAYYHRTIPATYHRYGKLAVLEDDMRHYHIRNAVSHTSICTRSPREAEMTTRRNWLNRWFDGCGIQILDAESQRETRPFTMDVLPVWRAIHDTQRVCRELGERPADSGNDTAVVVDWRERLRRVPKDQSAGPVYVASIVGLYASGVPVDLMTLDDFLAKPEGRYRRAVFLNAYSPEVAQRVALERRVRAEDFKSAWLLKRPFAGGGAASVVYEQMPDGGAAWQKLLTDLGAHAVAPAGNYVRRHGDALLFHTGGAGRWTLAVPGASGAVELYSGRRYDTGRLVVESDGPDTFAFRLRR